MTMPQRNWWHELNTWEPEIALSFYGRTLGWQFEPAPLPGGAAYWIARKDGKPVGGIFELTERESESKVPLLGDIPVVGNLFKQRTRQADKQEMLVFITPKMISDRGSVR